MRCKEPIVGADLSRSWIGPGRCHLPLQVAPALTVCKVNYQPKRQPDDEATNGDQQQIHNQEQRTDH